MISTELLMLKNVKICFVSYFMKIIHVELSDKWWKIAMPEIDGKDFLLKFLHILNHKRCAIEIPFYNVTILIILYRNNAYLENFESFRNKDRRTRSSLFSWSDSTDSILTFIRVPLNLKVEILFVQVFLYLHRNNNFNFNKY